MVGTLEEYTQVIGEAISNYEEREILAISKLVLYCWRFPETIEQLELYDENIQKKLKMAIYYQIKYDLDNDLLTSNGVKIANVKIGEFSYAKEAGYTGVNNKFPAYNVSSIYLINSTGINNRAIRL